MADKTMTSPKTEKTILAYNKNAGTYNNKFKDFASYRKKIVEFQKLFIPQGAKVLDLGCGPGNSISTIKSRDENCQFTGIDLSGELLNIARTYHPEATFIEQNICEFGILALGQFDTVIASFCIVHLSDEETAGLISSISNHLLPGGSLYLSFMEGNSSGYETTSFSKEEIYFNYYTAASIQKTLEENSLQVIEVSKEDYPEQDGSITSDVFMFARKQ